MARNISILYRYRYFAVASLFLVLFKLLFWSENMCGFVPSMLSKMLVDSENPELHNTLSLWLLMTCCRIYSSGGRVFFYYCCRCGSSCVVVFISTCGVFVLVLSDGMSYINFIFWCRGKYCVIRFTSSEK